MARPFIFRINAAELFTELQVLNSDQKAAFITQFSVDLLTLSGTLDYSKKVIFETLQLIEKRSESGKLGGRPKSKTKAKVKQRLSEAKANTKQEEELKEEVPYKEILEDLNQKGGYRYKVGEGIKKEINGRLSEGYSKEDFFHVHSAMIAKWKNDPAMCQYLRPDTLYRASKFPGYLNTAAPKTKRIIGPDGMYAEVSE